MWLPFSLLILTIIALLASIAGLMRIRKSPTIYNERELAYAGRERLRELIEAYVRLKPDALRDNASGSDSEIKRLKQKVENTKSVIRWSDLALAESCTIDALPTESLASELTEWRRQMRAALGDSRYAEYILTAPRPGAEPSRIRAAILDCVRIVYNYYSSSGIEARTRSYVTISTLLVGFSILCIGVMFDILLTAHWPGFPALLTDPKDLEQLLAASAAAVVGSLLSAQRRLQKSNVDEDPLYRSIQASADWVGIAVVPPLSGAIFGIIMYFLLKSNFVLGELLTTSPSDDSGIYRVILLGFIAGFAEQLIPDALNKIAARAFDSSNSSLSLASAASVGQRLGAPPSVNFLFPAKGPAIGDASVIILGTGFSAPQLAVTFGTAEAQIEKATEYYIMVKVPAGTPGAAVSVVVRTEYGQSAISKDAEFVYDHPRSVNDGDDPDPRNDSG